MTTYDGIMTPGLAYRVIFNDNQKPTLDGIAKDSLTLEVDGGTSLMGTPYTCLYMIELLEDVKAIVEIPKSWLGGSK